MVAAARTDAQLVGEALAGDDGAWRELVERFSAYVYAIARAHGLAPADAEDVFQDVFARTYTKLDRLRDPDALRPWLGQLTRRAAVDRLRKRREEPVERLDETVALDAGLDRIDLALDVRAAMAGLPPDSREVLDRFFARDQSYSQIGRELGIPPGTVASRISRGLTRMRQILAEPVS